MGATDAATSIFVSNVSSISGIFLVRGFLAITEDDTIDGSSFASVASTSTNLRWRAFGFDLSLAFFLKLLDH